MLAKVIDKDKAIPEVRKDPTGLEISSKKNTFKNLTNIKLIVEYLTLKVVKFQQF